jgi:light-regulated signal transduction histidine kinase (bacteriophytochrome)
MRLAGRTFHFIKDAVNRMSELLSGLLEYGRLGKQSKLTEVDLNEVVRDVIADLNYSITKTNAKIKIESLPTIRAYATEIRLLFQNLISNAIKVL